MFNQNNGNQPNIMQQFQQFQQQMSGKGDPRMLVQNLLNSGQMSQEQFNQFRMMANQLTGKNY